MCRSSSDGGIGRHAGLKILWAVMPVRVQFPLRVLVRFDISRISFFLIMHTLKDKYSVYGIREDIVDYIVSDIIPQYDSFDRAHQQDHATTVIDKALELAAKRNLNTEITFVSAACHDLGLLVEREKHHIYSGEIIRKDMNLSKWFSRDEIEIIAEAAEDHRASRKEAPRSIYGKIISEADRNINPDKIILRTILFSVDHFPQYDKELIWERSLEHLKEKYAEGGYLKLWLEDSPSEKDLRKLQASIKDEHKLRLKFEEIWNTL